MTLGNLTDRMCRKGIKFVEITNTDYRKCRPTDIALFSSMYAFRDVWDEEVKEAHLLTMEAKDNWTYTSDITRNHIVGKACEVLSITL